MTKDQAKRILLACRPHSTDQKEPDVADALRLAQRDPELDAWLEEQMTFNESVAAQLRSLKPPPGLKGAILAKHRVVVPLWKQPELLLAAACIALTLVLTALWARQNPGPGRAVTQEDQTFTGFRSRMVSFALRLYSMDIITNDHSQVREFLRAQGAPSDYALTAGLSEMSVKGGAKLSWQGHPVAMVCFNLTNSQTLYMFVMDQTAIQHGQPPQSTPVLAEVGGIATASWSRNGKVYLVAAATDPAALQRLLGSVRVPQFPRVEGLSLAQQLIEDGSRRLPGPADRRSTLRALLIVG